MPNWEFEFNCPDHEDDPTINLVDILKVIKEDVNFEVWLGGVMIFSGRIADIQKNKATEKIFGRRKVFRIGSRDGRIVFFTV